MKTIHTAQPLEYAWRCKTCHSGRGFGVARLTRELRASKHAREYPGHLVQLLVTVVEHEFSTRDNQAELALDSPPF